MIEKQPLPLQLVQDLAKRCPGVWEACDTIVEDRETITAGSGYYWDDLVRLPIAATVAIGQMFKPVCAPHVIGAYIQALYSWRYHKEIYRFDRDFFALVTDPDESDQPIPVDVLKRMPYPCYYIECELAPGYDGFFVLYDSFSRDFDHKNHLELRMLFVGKDVDPIALWLELDKGMTIADSLEASLRGDLNNLLANGRPGIMTTELFAQKIRGVDMSRRRTLLQSALQLILYLCCANADIAANPNQAPRRSSTGRVVDKYREIRGWDVGWRYGASLRQSRRDDPAADLDERSEQVADTEDTPAEEGQRRAVRPHMRRGHYHHYWTGKAGDKQLVLRWVHPMAVAFRGDPDDRPATIHTVKN